MAPSAEGPSGVPAVATISGLTASLRLPVLAALYANPEVTARGPAADAPTRCGSPGGALKDGHRGVDAEGHHQAGHRPGEPLVGAGHAVLDGQGAALEAHIGHLTSIPVVLAVPRPLPHLRHVAADRDVDRLRACLLY